MLVGYSDQGKPIRKTFYGESHPEITRKVAEATIKVFNGQVTPATQIPLATLIKSYLWTFKRPTVSDVTFDWYLSLSNTHLIPILGDTLVREVTPFQIQTLINHLHTEKKLAERTIKGVRELLSQSYKHAIEMKIAEVNPVSGTKLPKRSRVKENDEGHNVKIIPAANRAAILKIAESDQKMKTAITVLMFTGMRIGELLALTWGNVDFDNSIITIDRAITHTCTYNDDGSLHSRKTVVGDTKTLCSMRKIQVSSIVFDVLREWRDTLPNHMRRGTKKDLFANDAVVFPNDRGEMRTYDGFRTTYRRFMTENGLGDYTIHSYRHTFATMLLEQGVNPRVVQMLLGHRDIETTLGTYSHVLPEVFGGVADTMTVLHATMLSVENTPA